MGTDRDVSGAGEHYPGGSAPPASTLPSIVGTFCGLVGAVAVLLLLLGRFSDQPTLEILPVAIGPVLGASLGFLIRRRILSSRASQGLYFLQVRPVDPAGRGSGRWRFSWTLSMPGTIICRPRWSGADRELAVRHIHEPAPVHFLRTLLTADGPSRVMRVDTTGGALEFRGRPEYLHRLAVGAAP